MDMSVSILRHTLEILVDSWISKAPDLTNGHYSVDDILDQLIFEIIKEEYKMYSPKHTIQYYLEKYDCDGSNRKYTRAIQYAQHYRDYYNNQIKTSLNLSVPELDAQDMSGHHKFSGHSFTEQEFLMFKLQAECPLINKLHGHQIDSSKNVTETNFKELFNDYAEKLDELEPRLDNPNQVISRTFTYYGIETHFLTDFLYFLVVEAEKFNFPTDVSTDRILTIIAPTLIIPSNRWCPSVPIADLCVIPKWDCFNRDILLQDDKAWQKTQSHLIDNKRIKNCILQQCHQKFIEYMHLCSEEDKASFIVNHYWIWDKRPHYEWNSKRIRYFRKLHALMTQDIPCPHIK